MATDRAREPGDYWIRLAPTEPWEIARWDEENGCWWTIGSNHPWYPETVRTMIVGNMIERPK